MNCLLVLELSLPLWFYVEHPNLSMIATIVFSSKRLNLLEVYLAFICYDTD